MITLKKILTENDGPHEFGCVMLYFEFPELKEIQSKINKDDIYEEENDTSYGLEKNPHITLLYGLHNNVTVDNVKDAIKSVNDLKFYKCVVANMSLFKSKKYDVLKFDGYGRSLVDINKQLCELPHTSTFPDYHPHLTIGYLKSGKGKDYSDEFNHLTYVLTPTKVIYSEASGKKHEIKIDILNNI